MKKIFFGIIMLMIWCNVQGQATNISTDESSTWDQLTTKALQRNKYILIDAYATWCVPCKRMEKEVFSNDSVKEFMNANFITVKLQIDSTINDSPTVKAWRSDVNSIIAKYSVNELPTFLFFTPNGTLVYKDIGYKNVPEFMTLMKTATDSTNLHYYQMLYDLQRGQCDYKKMKDFAIKTQFYGNDSMAKKVAKQYLNHLEKDSFFTIDNIYFIHDVAGDKKMSDSLAKIFKENYLEKLADEQLFTKENFWFMNRFNRFLNSKDRFFLLYYSKPEKADTIMRAPDWSIGFVEQIISREELEDVLVDNKKAAKFKNPHWTKLQASIEKKYERIDSKKLVLNYQIRYYRRFDLNWRRIAKAIEQKVKYYFPSDANSSAIDELNSYCWDIFLNCNDFKVLSKALSWSKFVCGLSHNDIAAYLDTEANLLYKLGKVDEAIILEKLAVGQGQNDKDIEENLVKMQSRKPTWNTQY